ncbi:Short-chain dehydrogenase/reductase [Lachnellula hyalina]|uniref:Short-chain dehydrogenase/reductase n=1 Tax=Lachnellula hyalina TaxID=1316788 RepID=A0A8H8TXW2_9HELO|nr:Short-chain dehydrogenase/reductase [Lachnellula hyalina]TVY26484.1 Short-chain dehydrogenase/reductase [Lachnellula hyalina]
MPSISNHSILIIGGSSGIGFAAAKLALEAGARVAIASSNPTRVTSAVTSLKTSFPDSQISGYECDLSLEGIESRIDKLFNAATAKGTTLLNHVIYTAGRVPAVKPLAETEIEETIKSSQLGFAAVLAIAKLAPRYIKESYTSSITFTGGRVAEKPIPTYTLYSGMAAGLVAMVRNLALDMAPLRVNLVSPGATKTEMWGPPEKQEMIAKMVGAKALLGKVGMPEEVGEAYIYLMRNSDATGSVVSSNGGAVLQ